MGWPSAFTTRPSSSSPTGTEMMRPVRFTVSPSWISWKSPSSTARRCLRSGSARCRRRRARTRAARRPSPARCRAPSDAVTHRDDGTDLGDVDLARKAADLLAQDPRDFVCLDVHDGWLSVIGCRLSVVVIGWRRTSLSAPPAAVPTAWPRCRRKTVLPIRATTPPMSEGSTSCEIFTTRPVRSARTLARAAWSALLKGTAVDTSADTTCRCWSSRLSYASTSCRAP